MHLSHTSAALSLISNNLHLTMHMYNRYITSMTILSLLFGKLPGCFGVLALGFGDPAAALIGSKLGHVRVYGKKTLEGTAAFTLVSFIVFAVYASLLYDLPLSALVKVCTDTHSSFSSSSPFPLLSLFPTPTLNTQHLNLILNSLSMSPYTDRYCCSIERSHRRALLSCPYHRRQLTSARSHSGGCLFPPHCTR